MPPNGPAPLACNCRPVKPCFESIAKMVAASRQAAQGTTDSQQTPPGSQFGQKNKLPASRFRDVRDPDPELDVIPTVQCDLPEQATEPAAYPGDPCPVSATGRDQKTDSGKTAIQIEKELQAEAAKASCPCEACDSGALFDDCANPFTEFERKYLENGGDVEMIPATQLPHDCREHRDRPRDRAPGDPESDFYLKACQDCPCCLAFRPHPPATLATPDLYRTCGLPKRFKHPSWFKGYGLNCQHPLYRTTNADFGRYPPSIHTIPTVYHVIDRSWSKLYSQIGPYRDRSLRNSGSIWDAYSYYDFW